MTVPITICRVVVVIMLTVSMVVHLSGTVRGYVVSAFDSETRIIFDQCYSRIAAAETDLFCVGGHIVVPPPYSAITSQLYLATKLNGWLAGFMNS